MSTERPTGDAFQMAGSPDTLPSLPFKRKMMGVANPHRSNQTAPPADSRDRVRAESEQEVDIWWGTHNTRALLPGFVLCLLLTIIIALVAVYLWREHKIPALEVRYTAYAFIGVVWFVQLCRWTYFVITKTYRLTTRRLYLERTFSYKPFVPIELSRIVDVRVEQTAIERRLRVGKLRIAVQGVPVPVFVTGVYQPGDLAIELRRMVQEARERVAEATPPS